MANFDVAFEWLMDSEDPKRTFESTPDAPAGAFAIAGINSHSFPTAYKRIMALDQNVRSRAVADFYLTYFWTPGRFALLNNDEIAKRVFDTAVNMGSQTAVKILQRALEIEDDGEWGPNTIDAANKSIPEMLKVAFRAWRDREYNAIVKARPEDEKYLKGWFERAAR